MSGYLISDYFARSYFQSIDPVQSTALTMLVCDTAVFDSMLSTLRVTGQFRNVSFPTQTLCVPIAGDGDPVVCVVPLDWRETTDVDPNVILRTVRYSVAIIIRCLDPRTGYSRLDRLASLVQNLLDGADFEGLALSSRTRLWQGKLEPHSAFPAQQLTMIGEFAYRIDRSLGRCVA